MTLYFLGTSAGMPTRKRNVTSLALNRLGQSSWDLIDCGEATQHQIMRSCFSISKVKRIFITHLHGDHIYGLLGLLASRSFQTSEMINIYGPKGIKEFIQTGLRISCSRISYIIEYFEFENAGILIDDEQEIISTIALDHDIASYAYSFKQKDKKGEFLIEKAKIENLPFGRLYGRLKAGEIVTLEDGRIINGANYIGKSQLGLHIVVGGDNCRSELLTDILQNVDIFIHEATHTRKSADKVLYENKHSCAYQVAKVAENCQVKNLILTHFSSRFGKKKNSNGYSINDIYDEANQNYSGQLFLAADHCSYSFNKVGKLVINS